jgi:hypothetical protein
MQAHANALVRNSSLVMAVPSCPSQALRLRQSFCSEIALVAAGIIEKLSMAPHVKY